MAFTKSFPKRSDKSVYPEWVDVSLSKDEERKAEAACKEENVRLMRECLADAEKTLSERGLKGYETSLTTVAASLFDKRASHVAYWKGEVAREKFERL